MQMMLKELLIAILLVGLTMVFTTLVHAATV
jgi:hypothetical protein